MESDGRKYFSECVSTLVHFLQKVTIESTFQNVKEKKKFQHPSVFPTESRDREYFSECGKEQSDLILKSQCPSTFTI